MLIATAAPVESLAQTYEVDSPIVCLWRFDEFQYPHTTLTDGSAAAQADLRLMNGGRLVDGLSGRALRTSGEDFAVAYAAFTGRVCEAELRQRDEIPSGLWGPTEGPRALLQCLASSSWTWEFWLQIDDVDSACTIAELGQGYAPGMALRYTAGTLRLSNHYGGIAAHFGVDLSAAQWHRLELMRRGSTIRCFVDGSELLKQTVTMLDVQALPDLQTPTDREHESRGFEYMDADERRRNRFNIALGSDRRGSAGMRGMIDEMAFRTDSRGAESPLPALGSRATVFAKARSSQPDGPPLLFPSKNTADTLVFGPRRHLFVDDAIVAEMQNLALQLNHPWGRQEIVKDFEIKKSAWRPSVYDVDGVVHMAIPDGYDSQRGNTLLATSRDGITFSSYGTIIQETPLYGVFFRDLNSHVPADERYKLNAFVANRGMYFYLSGDGVNWRRNPSIQLPLRSGGGGECFWDDQRGVYMSFLKRDSSFKTRQLGRLGHHSMVFTSSDALSPWPFNALDDPYFEGWPFPAVTDEGRVAFAPTENGWVYRTRVMKYPWAPDVYLAFIWRYPWDPRIDAPRHVELAVSRNAEDWTFFDSDWYIPTGAAEEELAMYGLIRRQDEIWQYVDEGGAHGGHAPRSYVRYRQRLDGFVSLDARDEIGTALTRVLAFDGDALLLNVQVETDGWAQVALTDEAGDEVPGFGLLDCDQIRTNTTNHAVTWRGVGSVGKLRGEAIRLRFRLYKTKLYAFEFRQRRP